MKITTLLTLAAASLFLTARAADIEVQNLNDAGPGSLREAIALANTDTNADVITFNPALFAGGPQTIHLTTAADVSSTANSAFLISTKITIQGPAGPNGLTLQGPGAAGDLRHFKLAVAAADLTLENLIVTGGHSSQRGGVVFSNLKGKLTVIRSVLSDNHSDTTAGAILGSVTLIESIVAGNSGVGLGGAIACNSSSDSIQVIRSTISGNHIRVRLDPESPERGIVAFGGGIWANCGLTVIDSTISGNQSEGRGGGIYSDPASSSIFHAVINSTITGNRSDADGNGFNIEPGDNQIYGGGMFIASSGAITLHNTIVTGNFRGTGNTADDIYGNAGKTVDASSSHNLIGTGGAAGMTDGVNGNLVGHDASSVLDPLLANNGGPTPTHALILGSPAIDAGDNAQTSSTTDQRGLPRFANGTVDIGAFEFQLAPPPNRAPEVACAAPSVFNCAPASGVLLAVHTGVTDFDAGQTLTVVLKQGANVLDVQQVPTPVEDALVTFNALTFLPGAYALTVEVSDGIASASCDTSVTVNAGVAGDFNGDCCVDRADLALMSTAIRAGARDLIYDLNGDGIVSKADLRWLKQHFSNPAGAPCNP